MKFLKRLFNFFCCVVLLEVKNFNFIIDRIFYYLSHFNIIKLVIFKVGFKNIVPFSSRSFNEFIKTKKLILVDKDVKEEEKIILIENYINQPLYTYTNLISGLFLKKIYNYKIYGLLRRGDLKAEILFKKFNINNIIYIDEPNFFERIKYAFKAIKYFNHPISITKFCKLKYRKTDLGLSSYDSYIRYKKIPREENTNYQILSIFAQGMFKCDQMISKVFSNKKIKKILQSETVFNPLQTLFQLSLLNNVEVYSRCGNKKISIRKYNNSKQIHQYRYNISNEIFNRVYKSKRNQALTIFKKNFDKNDLGADPRTTHLKKNKKKFIKKNKIYNYLKIEKKPIVSFFLNHLIDRNFHSGPRINFQDNLTWIDFVFNEIIKYKKVNWIIKPHPTEKYYGSKIDLISIIKKLEKKHKNIKLYPDELSNLTLLNATDLALTSHGTVGIEYPAFGVKSMYVNKSNYSNMDFSSLVNNKKKIIEKFRKVHLAKKPLKIEIDKSRVFLVIQKLFILNDCSLIPVANIKRNINEEKFWRECKNLMLKFDFKNDEFYQMLKEQIKYKTRHTYNYNLINIPKIQMSDFNN